MDRCNTSPCGIPQPRAANEPAAVVVDKVTELTYSLVASSPMQVGAIVVFTPESVCAQVSSARSQKL